MNPIALLDMPVSDVLAANRTTARVFLDRGMNCVGCPFSAFDTVAEVAAVYGLDPLTLATALSEVEAGDSLWSDAMTITENTLVADIAAALPSSVRLFQQHGIDFCCGGKRPFGVVCEEQGLSFTDLARAIEASAAAPAGDRREWRGEPLHAIIDHIVSTYHEPLRTELPRLQSMASRVLRVHEKKAPHLLARIDTIVTDLSLDLNQHMGKEESVLFPAIRALEADGRPGSAPRLAAPVNVLEQEHDRVGALLAELRKITDDYVAPAWACRTFQALYHGLEDLEASMHVHVHLENNVLFPRALRAQSSMSTNG
jgi:regulator of cell morphogenesis and NO signaling